MVFHRKVSLCVWHVSGTEKAVSWCGVELCGAVRFGEVWDTCDLKTWCMAQSLS